MKSLLPLISLMILSFTCVHAQQNHVINGNFEGVQSCPANHSQVSRCIGWRQYTAGTSDYYHSCSNTVGVPGNNNGYQQAASGQAYMGGIQYTSYSSGSDKEYIAGTMTPLTPGRAYKVSMSLSLANNSNYGCNDMGVYFYDTTSYTVNTWDVLNVTPQVIFTDYGPIMDTTDWVRVSKVFVADSAYDNLVIGGFLSYNMLSSDSLTNNGTGEAYYYIDSVVVVPVDTFEQTYITDTVFCTGDTFSVEFTTLIRYNVNNVYTAQLSDKNGDFSSPTDIGSLATDSAGYIFCTIPNTVGNGSAYQLRIVSSSPADTTGLTTQTLTIANPDSTTYNATATNSPVCAGSIANFAGTVSFSPATYYWTGPNGFASTAQNPGIAVASLSHNGVYTATIKFNGCEVSDTANLVVTPTPALPVAGSTSPVCAGEDLQLYATSSTSGVSYKWIGPLSYSSTQQNPVLSNSTLSMNGTYTVVATLNGCDIANTTVVTIKPAPNTPTLSSNSPICEGDSLGVTLSPPTTGASYLWVGPNGHTAHTQSTDVINATTVNSGWYKVIVDMQGCSVTDSISATVNQVPDVPSVSFTGPYCVGETITINAGTVTGGPVYKWTGPGNYTYTGQNAQRNNIQMADTGMYYVRTSIANCSAEKDSVRVTINPAPFTVIQTSPGDTICSGAPVVFTALPNLTGGSPTYQWYVNAQPAGTGMIYTSSSMSDGDIVRCDMTEYTKCSVPMIDESNLVKLTVLPWLAPSATITANPNGPLKKGDYVKFTANVTNGGPMPVYQWKRNGNDVQGATGNVWGATTLSDNDKVHVEVTSTYRCPLPRVVNSNDITVQVLASVGNLDNGSHITLYPNPNNGSFVLSGDMVQKDILSLTVHNTLGQQVFADVLEHQKGAFNEAVNISELPAGLYILKLRGQHGEYTTRFNIE